MTKSVCREEEVVLSASVEYGLRKAVVKGSRAGREEDDRRMRLRPVLESEVWRRCLDEIDRTEHWKRPSYGI